MRQGDGATDVLISLTGVDTKAEVSLDGLVEVGGCNLFDESNSLTRGVELSGINLLSGGAVLLTVLSHNTYLLWSNGPEPSHINACPIARKRARHASCPKLPKQYRYSAMVTPMERAVPATIFLAASISLALRSGILISAILVSCS